MAYDSRAVKVKKAEKIIAIMSFNQDRERHYIREIVKAEQRNTRMRSARNRGKDEE